MRTHAKLALLMVLVVVKDPTSIEKRFLAKQVLLFSPQTNIGHSILMMKLMFI
jgi:hypothetical protein